MKAEKVSKPVRSSKKTKVADLPKGKKKEKAPSITGFTRGMGLFFIAIIGILSGLLLFNMIIHFGVSDALEESLLSQTLTSDGSGKASQGVAYTPESETGLNFSFKHSSSSEVSELTEGGDTKALYVTDGIPIYSNQGIATIYIASFEISRESLDDTVTKLLKKKGATKKVTISDAQATEITNPGEDYKYLVFQNKNTVYVSKLNTTKGFVAEADLIEGSLTLTK
jgi:hypothetical protein